MSSSSTLNSRLRVLVAKTFRAEKLYSSIRNTSRDARSSLKSTNSRSNAGDAAQVNSSGSQGPFGAQGLSEVANDVRAKEWQQCHYVLRLALNDILALGNSQEQAKEVLRLREEFSARADESQELLDRSSQSLTELAKRQEFAHAMKLSVELIRNKARIQASRVIADELNALLSASARNTDASKLEPRAEVPEPVETETYMPTNVVSLSQRRAAGGRRGRI